MDSARALSRGACADAVAVVPKIKSKGLRDLRIGEILWHAEFPRGLATCLQSFEDLESLYLSKQIMNEDAMAALTRTSVTELFLRDIWFPVPTTLDAVVAMKGLRTLTMQNTTIKRATLIRIIKALPKLVHLDVHGSSCLVNYVGAVASCIETHGKTIIRAIMSTVEDTHLLYLMSEFWDDDRAATRRFEFCKGEELEVPSAVVMWRSI